MANVLVSVDPGNTIGICRFDINARSLWSTWVSMDEVWLLLSCWFPIRWLVVERWFLYPGPYAKRLTFSDMPGPEAIGVIRSWGMLHGITRLDRVAARLRRPYLSRVPEEIKNEHSRDAAAIGLYWLASRTNHVFQPSEWEMVVYAPNGAKHLEVWDETKY